MKENNQRYFRIALIIMRPIKVKKMVRREKMKKIKTMEIKRKRKKKVKKKMMKNQKITRVMVKIMIKLQWKVNKASLRLTISLRASYKGIGTKNKKRSKNKNLKKINLRKINKIAGT